MSHHFAASAFKGLTSEALGAALQRYCESHGAACSEVTRGAVNESTDATLYRPINGWTVAVWPSHFNIHDVRLCAAVTAATGTVAMTVNVYEGAFWSHEVLKSGTLVDRFSPWGDYFAEDGESAVELRTQWAGSALAAARALEVAPDVLQPYYRYVGDSEAGKANPEDEFPLEDFWVFTDLWRRIGAIYPPNPDDFVHLWRLNKNFGGKLPTWEGEPL